MMVEDKKRQQEIEGAVLVRILGKDIRGDKKVLVGLRSINGISWAFGNAICKKVGIDKDKRIQELTPEERGNIEEFVNNPELLGFLKNRQKDFDSGDDKHLHGSDLKLRKEFDVKRLKKIKSYRGIRHTLGLPTRGQRTKANFRKNRKKSGAVGVKKKK